MPLVLPPGAVLAQKFWWGMHCPISPIHHRVRFIRSPKPKNELHIGLHFSGYFWMWGNKWIWGHVPPCPNVKPPLITTERLTRLVKTSIEGGRALLAKQPFGRSETMLTVDGRASGGRTRASSFKALHTSLARVVRAATTPLVLQTYCNIGTPTYKMYQKRRWRNNDNSTGPLIL